MVFSLFYSDQQLPDSSSKHSGIARSQYAGLFISGKIGFFYTFK